MPTPVQPSPSALLTTPVHFRQDGVDYAYDLPAVGSVLLPAGVLTPKRIHGPGPYRLRRTPRGRILLEQFDRTSQRWRHRSLPASAHLHALIKAWQPLALPTAPLP